MEADRRPPQVVGNAPAQPGLDRDAEHLAPTGDDRRQHAVDEVDRAGRGCLRNRWVRPPHSPVTGNSPRRAGSDRTGPRGSTGTLTCTRAGPAGLLINIRGAVEADRLALDVDDVFIRAATVPEPASLALRGAGLRGRGAAMRRRYANGSEG